MPTNATCWAVASSDVHLRAAPPTSVTSATPKFAPVISRPIWSAVPPLTPAKARTLLAPMVNRRALTVAGAAVCTPCALVAADSVTAWSRCSMAKPPLTWKKPKASSVSVPLAFSTLPSLPAMSSVSVLPGPVATTRFCAA